MSDGDRTSVDRLFIGTSYHGSATTAEPVYDAFWAAGGRRFDTAWIYGQSFSPGCCELVLGEWLRSRGVASEVCVLAKGAHTPECLPEYVRPQLLESLERLQLPQVGLYMLHRDNLDVPVLEFMEVMQSVQNEGLVGSYGFSNWSLPRVRQASMIAAQGGHAGLTAISNHLSILDMVEPVHPGTCSSRGHKWESWLRDSGMSLVPWASQGRGVFTLTDAVELRQSILGRHWWSEDNEERLRRALRIAPKYGISATGLALQWVLCRPIDVYPIIGPRTPDELRDSLKALEVTIDIADLDWVEQV